MPLWYNEFINTKFAFYAMFYFKGNFYGKNVFGRQMDFAHGQTGSWLRGGCALLRLRHIAENGAIDDPFYKTNEHKCLFIAETGKSFKRSFKISQEQLEYRKALLRCQMLDTLAQIYINGQMADISSNAYVCSETNITDYLHEGENTIEIHFLSPIEYVKSKQSEAPLPPNANGIDGVPYIRKPACHFGWDWGINMPVSGIFGNIEILFYNNEIRDFGCARSIRKTAKSNYISKQTRRLTAAAK